MDIESLAVRAGRSAWVERRLFELLGAWVTTTADPAAKRLFASHCHQHAWHADLWCDRIPVLRHIEADSVVVAPSDAVAALLDDIASLEESPGRVSAVYGVVLPALVEAYGEWLDDTDAAVDAPTARVLTLVLNDLTAAVRDGDALAAALGAPPPDDQRLTLAASILG